MSSVLPEENNELQLAKITMLESNISRVLNRNRKLRGLLDYSQHFDRLQEFVSTVQQNWSRIGLLTEKVSRISQQLKINQKQLHIKINQCHQYISNNIQADMQKISIKIREHQLRIQDAEHKMKTRARNQLQALKVKVKKDLSVRMEHSIKIVQKCQNALLRQYEEHFIPSIVTGLIEQFADKNQRCQIQLGHIYNLVLYKLHQASNTREGPKVQQEKQQDYQELGKTLYNLIEDSCCRMNQQLQDMELNIKKVNSEASWLKNQVRIKKKNANNETVTLSDRPASSILAQVREQLQDTKSNSLGLGKYCDRLLLIRRIKRSQMPKSQREGAQKQQSELLQSSKYKMLWVRQRITKISAKLQQLSQFYSQF